MVLLFFSFVKTSIVNIRANGEKRTKFVFTGSNSTLILI